MLGRLKNSNTPQRPPNRYTFIPNKLNVNNRLTLMKAAVYESTDRLKLCV